jgi:Pvc16 N-terminal domain
MSNALAIAAVTATLRDLLDKKLDKLAPVKVTARSLDKAREVGGSGDQVNLFLYQTMPDAAWRNMDMPRQLKTGETGQPPLPLILSYLLTAYSDDTDDVKSQILLGRAMSALHDHPLLGSAEIEDVATGDLKTSDLHEQLERMRITLQPLPLEELSKLWTAFQVPYRTSAAYQVSVVLIESTRSAKTPLPVLERGKGDTGVASQADVDSPFPALLDLVLPAGQQSARLGDLVTLQGLHLDGDTVTVSLSNPRLDAPLSSPAAVTVTAQSATEVVIRLESLPALWVAGLYTVAVTVETGDDVRTTNELPLAVAPSIATPLPLVGVVRAPVTFDATILLQVSPEVRPGQRAALLIGNREVAAEAHAVQTASLTFVVKNAPDGTHFLRLRIDGVDSLLILPGPPPSFDPIQRVTFS